MRDPGAAVTGSEMVGQRVHFPVLLNDTSSGRSSLFPCLIHLPIQTFVLMFSFNVCAAFPLVTLAELTEWDAELILRATPGVAFP